MSPLRVSDASLSGKFRFPFEVTIVLGTATLDCEGDAWVVFTKKPGDADLSWRIHRLSHLLLFDSLGVKVRLAPMTHVEELIEDQILNNYYGDIEEKICESLSCI